MRDLLYALMMATMVLTQACAFQAENSTTQIPEPNLESTTTVNATASFAATASNKSQFLLWCDLRGEYSDGNGIKTGSGIYTYQSMGYQHQISSGTYSNRPYIMIGLGCRFAEENKYQTPASVVNQHIAPTIFYFNSGRVTQRDDALRAMAARGNAFPVLVSARREPWVIFYYTVLSDAFLLNDIDDMQIW